jgi:hypothetical protein
LRPAEQFETIVPTVVSQEQVTTSSHLPQTEPPTVQEQAAIEPPGFTWRITRMIGIFIAVVLVALALVLFLSKRPNCSPPNLVGVTLYELPCYEGRSLTLTNSDLDLCDNALDPAQGKVDPCFSAPSWNDIASSMWVGPGYRVELHLHSPEIADDSMLSFECSTPVLDFGKLRFPNGDSVDNNVSRVIIQKMDCG